MGRKSETIVPGKRPSPQELSTEAVAALADYLSARLTRSSSSRRAAIARARGTVEKLGVTAGTIATGKAVTRKEPPHPPGGRS